MLSYILSILLVVQYFVYGIYIEPVFGTMYHRLQFISIVSLVGYSRLGYYTAAVYAGVHLVYCHTVHLHSISQSIGYSVRTRESREQ